MRLCLLATLTVALLSAMLFGTAAAAPDAVRVEEVYRAADCNDVCDPDEDQGLDEGVTVQGVIQVHLFASSEVLGLGRIRLEAQYASDPRFYCLQQWDGGNQREFRASFNWDTRAWPDPSKTQHPCPEASSHIHGPTGNGIYKLRVSAVEAVNGEEGRSETFRLGIVNRNPKPTTSACAPPCGEPTTGGTITGGSPPPNGTSASPTASASPGASAAASPSPPISGSTPAVAAPAAPPGGSSGSAARPFLLFLATVLVGGAGVVVGRELLQRIGRFRTG